MFPKYLGDPLYFPSISHTAMASHTNNHWEAPKFNFNSPHQLEDWKIFYTRALDYLEALNIDNAEADDQGTDWKQLKMMFKGKDRQDSPVPHW